VADTLDVDELIARLYTAPPEDFVKVRAEGVKRLKAADQDDAAADFGKLAKPSVPAWAINLLVSQRVEALDEVVARGDELRQAHTGGGDAKDIRAAQRARQEALRAATAVASELTGRRLSEAHRAEIEATLEAASSDAATADEVRRGRLVRPLDAPTGFDLFGGLTVVSGGRSDRRPGRSTRTGAAQPAGDAGADDGADERAQRARASMLRTEADSALAAAAEAGESAAELRDRVTALEEQREGVERELRRLDDELTAARREARQAERAATDAARKAARAASRAERADP
jgi:hypothetical protein